MAQNKSKLARAKKGDLKNYSKYFTSQRSKKYEVSDVVSDESMFGEVKQEFSVMAKKKSFIQRLKKINN